MKSNLKELDFVPDIFLTGPIYKLGTVDKVSSHSSTINAEISFHLPTDGQLAVNIEDSISFTENMLENDWSISQSPKLTLSYTQPAWFNGSFFDFSLYSKAKDYHIVQPEKIDGLKLLIKSNNYIISIINKVLDIYELDRKIGLISLKLELLNDELEILKSEKNNGNITGSKYWEKQLELDKVKLELSKYKSQLDFFLIEFSELYNYTLLKHDFDYSFVLNNRFIQLDNILSTPAIQIKSIEKMILENERDLNKKKHAANISTSFSIEPKYGTRDETMDIYSSFNDFNADDSYLDYTLLLNIELSSVSKSKNKRENEIISSKLKILDQELTMVKQSEKRKLKQLYHSSVELGNVLLTSKEELEYAEILEKEENNLFKIGRSTQLLVKQSAYNKLLKQNNLLNTESEIIRNKLRYLSIIGIDIYKDLL